MPVEPILVGVILVGLLKTLTMTRLPLLVVYVPIPLTPPSSLPEQAATQAVLVTIPVGAIPLALLTTLVARSRASYHY